MHVLNKLPYIKMHLCKLQAVYSQQGKCKINYCVNKKSAHRSPLIKPGKTSLAKRNTHHALFELWHAKRGHIFFYYD